MSMKRLYKFAKEAGLTKTEGKYGGWIATDEELLRLIQISNQAYKVAMEQSHNEKMQKVNEHFKSFGEHCYKEGMEAANNLEKK